MKQPILILTTAAVLLAGLSQAQQRNSVQTSPSEAAPSGLLSPPRASGPVKPPHQSNDPFAPNRPSPVKPAPPTSDPFGSGRPAPSRSPADPFGGPQPRYTVPQAARGLAGQGVNLHVRYEVFSAPGAEAASLLRKGLSDEQLYETLVKMVNANESKQEALICVTTRSGQRSSSEAITEYVYPAEYGESDTPAAYETRNIGITLEVEAIVDPKTGEIEMRVAPEHVTMTGINEWGPDDAKQAMPQFESRRLSTVTRMSQDMPRLLGTVNRPAGPQEKEASAPNQIWIAFATVSRVK